MGASVMRWWQLPDVVGLAHNGLLETFQQLVELRESVRVLAELASVPVNDGCDWGVGDVARISPAERWRSLCL